MQAPDTTRWGTYFRAPVGTNTGTTQSFEISEITVMAENDNTYVQFDLNGDGTNDLGVWLDQGKIPHDERVRGRSWFARRTRSVRTC